jgi:hypothetical protein
VEGSVDDVVEPQRVAVVDLNPDHRSAVTLAEHRADRNATLAQLLAVN